jgi:NADH:ubiquinone oxidoreductase subunit H
LFLGGYKFPFELAALERAANIFEYAIFLAKVAIVTAVSLWVTYSMPRARIDQVSFFSWHLLMPLSIVSYILTLIWVATTGGRGLWVEL